METLLDKFDSITLDAKCLVSDADATVCQRAMEERDLVLYQLQESESAMLNISPVLKSLTKDIVSQFPAREFSTFCFNPTQPIKEIESMISVVERQMVSILVSHFNATYNLQIDNQKISSAPHWSDIVLEILALAGGVSFASSGENKLIYEFNNAAVMKRRGNPVLKGVKISFPWYSIVRHYWAEEYKLDRYNNSRVKLLSKAISFFERQSLSIDSSVQSILNDNSDDQIDFSLTYPLIGSTRFTGFKIFKNERLDLSFASAQFAHDFFTMFQLNKDLDA